MTRAKKTRSLKRIHDVQTGSKSKIKKANQTNRQTGKRVQGRRVPSVYEKFLAENPDAKKQATLEQQQAEKKQAEKKQTEKKQTEKKQTEKKSEERKLTAAESRKNSAEKKAKIEREKTLLEQLEDANMKDIF